VGKSFVARRLAYLLLGEEDADRVEMVQFHPSYSYEDFIMGYRATEKGGFEREAGVFLKFVRDVALANPKQPHVFIIDELNRANLGKVLGECMLLLESDKRGPAHKVRLHYGNEFMYLPDNLYVIGTMNTADRSLALVDFALRRRFAFKRLKP
jgi:5-methylcytosine-specific restriction protein B